MDQITKDLVAALKFLCDAVETEGEHGPNAETYVPTCDICAGIREAREAIAKAEKQG